VANTIRMHPLDNVIWNALTARQRDFAESFDEARKFLPEVTSLGGFREPTARGYESLAGLLPDHGTVALFLAEPYEERTGWNLVARASLLQMVYRGESIAHAKVAGLRPADRRGRLSPHQTPKFVELGPTDSSEMIELTALTKPGPFSKRTHELGTYLGIRRDGELVAMAGERMKVPGYTEVSAVCTRPGHTGNGYAQMLMMEVMRRIVERGETPFLHVREDNVRAIELYERLGFRQRARLHLAVLRRD
jgi:ribosomal protein S18 acetylase RimI-like enzyme